MQWAEFVSLVPTGSRLLLDMILLFLKWAGFQVVKLEPERFGCAEDICEESQKTTVAQSRLIGITSI
jgi:hypothetical protein